MVKSRIMISRRLRFHLAVYAAYLLVAVLITYPLVTTLATRLIGHPFGDAYEYVHHIWWIKHALQTGQSPFFQPLLTYPHGLSSWLLWTIPLQSFPAWLFAFVMPLAAAFNLSALLTLALNGWAMYVLARDMIATTSPQSATLAALMSGLIFMALPTFQGQLGAAHTGLLALWPVPLFALGLVRLRVTAQPARKLIVGTALALCASLWGSLLTAIYVLAPLIIVYVAKLIAERRLRALRHVAAALVLGGLLMLPFALPSLPETINARLPEGEQGDVRYSAPLLSAIAPSFYHPLFSDFDYARRALGVDPFEHAGYLGLAAGLLALIGAWRGRGARWWLIVGLSAWILSLGPLLKLEDAALIVTIAGYETPISLPGVLLQGLPFLSIARTPGRFDFAVGLALAALAAYGAAWLLMRIRRRASRFALAGLLAAAVVFEFQWWWPLPTIPAAAPEAVTALAAREDIRAVLDIPWAHPLTDKEALFLQISHQQPLIAGHITRSTPVNPALATLLEATLNPALLDAAGVDVIILHKAWAADDSFARRRLGAPFYEDDQYALFEVPPTPSHEVPAFTYAVGPGDAGLISDRLAIDIYAPAAGSAVLVGLVASDDGAPRDAVLSLDGDPIVRWTVNGAVGLRVSVEFAAAGFYRLTLAAEPACPASDSMTLRCCALRATDLALVEFTPRPAAETP